MSNLIFQGISSEVLIGQLCSKFEQILEEKLKSYSSEQLLSRTKAAEFLGITTTTLSKRTDDGQIPAYTIGGRVLYKKSELLDSLERKPYLKSV